MIHATRSIAYRSRRPGARRMVPDSGIVVADNAPVAHGETVMSKKAKAKTGPREEAGKKSRPMDASEAVVRLRVGRTGLASLLFAVLRPKDARAAAVNPNALRLTHGSRYTKIPLGDIVAAKVKTGWCWCGIRFRHAAGEAFVSGLSRDDARAASLAASQGSSSYSNAHSLHPWIRGKYKPRRIGRGSRDRMARA